MIRETIINVVPSDDDHHRLVIAIEKSDDEQSRLVMRQETRSENVGWFVQSRVAILPEQVAGLKMALSTNQTRQMQSPAAETSPIPAILNFRDALAAS
jgi:hypothetical protein